MGQMAQMARKDPKARMAPKAFKETSELKEPRVLPARKAPKELTSGRTSCSVQT